MKQERRSMTKVWMNSDLLDYQQDMKDVLRQVLQWNHIGGVPQPEPAEPRLARKDLLPPPYIGFIALDGYLGQGDDYIGLTASHDFGIHSMHITIVDSQGNVIESGEMSPFPGNPDLWEYPPQACVPPGTSVTVLVTAIDCMGGIGRGWERKTMGEEDW
jgi:hypothetical protein